MAAQTGGWWDLGEDARLGRCQRGGKRHQTKAFQGSDGLVPPNTDPSHHNAGFGAQSLPSATSSSADDTTRKTVSKLTKH